MPRPSEEVRCDTCQAFVRKDGEERGQCRFNAPTDAGSKMDWPTLPYAQWCMQWRPLGTQLPLAPELPVQQVARGRKVDLSD